MQWRTLPVGDSELETINATLKGESPFIMQADTLADPLHPLTKELRAVTSKKNKTDADHVEMGRIEFIGGLYIDAADGPYIPSDYIFKALVEAARMNKSGKMIERGAFVLQDRFTLEYDGPRTLEKLLATKDFHYRKTVVISNRRTVRVRPIFKQWSCIVEVAFEPDIVNRSIVMEALDRAGKYIGIGNRRPNKGGNFGRFSVAA